MNKDSESAATLLLKDTSADMMSEDEQDTSADTVSEDKQDTSADTVSSIQVVCPVAELKIVLRIAVK